MDIKKKLKEYKEKFKNEELLKFVDFLEILEEWVEILKEKKRISTDQEQEILNYFPKKIFEELKESLLKETTNFLVQTIKKGKVRMIDFDSVQFNLYAVFGKERIASMVEHIRIKLEDIILKQRLEEQEKIESAINAEKDWLNKIRNMPEKDLIKLLTREMFKITPSARTNQERLDSIKKNQNVILEQKNKFHKFEQKIVDATIEAKANAEVNVNKQVGKVTRKIELVSQEFREKAKEFVSEEGPKKMINEAIEMISSKKEILQKSMEGKGKKWEMEFGKKIKTSQEMIQGKRDNLISSEEIKRKLIYKTGKSQLKKAEIMLTNKTEEFKDNVEVAKHKFTGKAEKVFEKGNIELDKARVMILKEKSEFEDDVTNVRIVFSDKGKEIILAKDDFIGKRDIAAELFIQRGFDIESEMFSTIYKEKRRFEKERDTAANRFLNRGDEIRKQATSHISSKKEKFIKGRDSARKRFLEKSEGITGTDSISEDSIESEGKSRLSSGAEKAKGKVGKAQLSMVNKAKLNREKMINKMVKQRDLFRYDVRFARDEMQQHAKQFSEKIAEKREEFETAQEKIVARHKARQKAIMIHNLLRTIRTMK